MIHVTLEPYELALAAHTGCRRHIDALGTRLVDRFGAADGLDGWTLHIEGACGEIAFAKALNRYWAGTVNTFKDADVGTGVQVRTRSRANYDLIVRDGDADDQAFVLVTGTAPRFCVHGWLYGHEAKQPDWLGDHGSHGPAYFVPQSALRPINTGDK